MGKKPFSRLIPHLSLIPSEALEMLTIETPEGGQENTLSYRKLYRRLGLPSQSGLAEDSLRGLVVDHRPSDDCRGFGDVEYMRNDPPASFAGVTRSPMVWRHHVSKLRLTAVGMISHHSDHFVLFT